MIETLYRKWLNEVKDESLREELCAMQNDEKKKEDCFYKGLLFGTGGLRGVLGVGTNRMNIHTVGRATFGLASYLKEKHETPSVVIAYDTRNKSEEFAQLIAEIMSYCGVEAYLFDSPMPTPLLSFAVRKLQTSAGIVITASHNPKEYNGYKVYNEKGCQITDGVAAEITERIEKHGYFQAYHPQKDRIHTLGEEILNAFLDEIEKYRLTDIHACEIPSIVYTPLHGTGRIPVEKLFARMGITTYVTVPEQAEPNGEFTTCPYPNPEEREALQLAVALAKKQNTELVLATDPDADRIGVVVRTEEEYRYLTGNETGVLLENYILSVRKNRGLLRENATIVKTIVTTDMATKIAENYGVKIADVLTGFKYIGETIDRLSCEEDYIFGLEESYGYLVGAHARDKDAVSAIMLIVEMATYYKKQGKTLSDVLNELYEKYGYYVTRLRSYKFEGSRGQAVMSEMIENIRFTPFSKIGGERTQSFIDYAKGIDGLPKSNVLSFASKNCKVIIRPSGTEPKLKIYYFTNGADQQSANARLEVLERDVKMKIGLERGIS